MIIRREGNITSEPCRRCVGIRCFFGWKFYFCQKQSLIIFMKNVELDRQTVFFRNQITCLGDDKTVCLRFQMFIGLLRQRKIIFLSGHEAF